MAVPLNALIHLYSYYFSFTSILSLPLLFSNNLCQNLYGLFAEIRRRQIVQMCIVATIYTNNAHIHINTAVGIIKA